MPVVHAEGLTKSFGTTRALQSLDLSIERGSVLGVLGPNGAGTTTAVRILTTLLRPDAGSATIDGVDVIRDPRGVRTRIGLTGQYAAVDERLTAIENLELIGRFFRMSARSSRARAGELLERFELSDAADRVVSGYSGGMRRRLDIAMSLVARPVVLFLDEPTTGLDPRSRLGMWDLIDELVRDGMTTLLTTQYLDEADRLADRIMVIDHGRAIARGTAAELKDQLGGARAEITLVAGSEPASVVEALRGHVGGTGAPSQEGDVLSVPLRSGVTVPQLMHALDAAEVEIVDLSVEHPTLDDVFLTLTGRPAEDPTIEPINEPTIGAAEAPRTHEGDAA
jgi:ABC-2 type transport system ATP-binding protein